MPVFYRRLDPQGFTLALYGGACSRLHQSSLSQGGGQPARRAGAGIASRRGVERAVVVLRLGSVGGIGGVVG